MADVGVVVVGCRTHAPCLRILDASLVVVVVVVVAVVAVVVGRTRSD